MSCVIVNNRVMSATANLLSRMLNMRFDSFGFEIRRELEFAFKDCYVNRTYSAKKIYEHLYKLNFKAYAERYGKCAWATFDTFIEDKQYQMVDIDIWEGRAGDDHARSWHYQALKCLQEVYYQLCEGEVYDYNETKALGDLINTLCVFIVTHSEEYEKAKLV